MKSDLEGEAAKYPPGTKPVPLTHQEPVSQVPDTPGKVKIRNVKTGKVIERWTIDAKDLVACGEFEWVGDPPRQILHHGRLST